MESWKLRQEPASWSRRGSFSKNVMGSRTLLGRHFHIHHNHYFKSDDPNENFSHSEISPKAHGGPLLWDSSWPFTGSAMPHPHWFHKGAGLALYMNVQCNSSTGEAAVCTDELAKEPQSHATGATRTPDNFTNGLPSVSDPPHHRDCANPAQHSWEGRAQLQHGSPYLLQPQDILDEEAIGIVPREQHVLQNIANTFLLKAEVFCSHHRGVNQIQSGREKLYRKGM